MFFDRGRDRALYFSIAIRLDDQIRIWEWWYGSPSSAEGSNTTTKTKYITVGPLYATTNGAYTILKFNSTGSTRWMPPSGVNSVDYLLVGGGGQGGIGALYSR